MTTAWPLMAQYEGLAVIPLERIARDYFDVDRGGLPGFLRRLDAAEIPHPVTRMGRSQKGARGVYLHDPAAYIDARRAAGMKKLQQMQA